MKNFLHELATAVGFEVVNVDDGFINYEFSENISNIENVSYIIQVADSMTRDKYILTFEAIINVLPKNFRKRIYKLVKHSDIYEDDKSNELVLFAINEYRFGCIYNKLKDYGALLNVDIEKLGYNFTYNLSKKAQKTIMARIEQNLPMELAPVVGNIKKIEYKIGYIKNLNNKEIN